VRFIVFHDITSSQHFFRDGEKQEICDGILNEATESFEDKVNLNKEEEGKTVEKSRFVKLSEDM